MEDLGQHAEITLERGENGDFVFESLQLGEDRFTCAENPLGFAQWAYLVSPQAFELALTGTKYDATPGFVVRQTAKLTDASPLLVLEWELTVRHLVCAYSGDGIRVETRQFPLVMAQSREKRTRTTASRAGS